MKTENVSKKSKRLQQKPNYSTTISDSTFIQLGVIRKTETKRNFHRTQYENQDKKRVLEFADRKGPKNKIQ